MNYQYKNHYEGNFLAKARSSFVQKVYSILALQLIVTTLFVLLNVYSDAFANFQLANIRLAYFMIFVGVVSALALSFFPKLTQTFPSNYAILGAFTLSQSYLVSFICGLYTPETVLLSALATAGATIGITLYAMTTKNDFTKFAHSFYAFMSGLFLVLLLLSLFNIFLRTYIDSSLLAVVFSIIYMIYLLIDTQLILGGKNKELSLDNPIMGAMILYVDIVSLFLKLLELLGEKKEKKK